MSARDERGYSLVEVLVGAAMFSMIAVGFMAVLFSVSRATESTADSVRVSEEARLGLNRLVRDTREAAWIDLTSNSATATHNSFTVKIDYNADGAYTNPAPTNAHGSYEIITYTYEPANDRITVTAPGVGTETLVRGVDCAKNANTGACLGDVFSFTSNRLEYDWDRDGVTTLAEIDAAPCALHGVTALDTGCNNGLVSTELAVITSVNVAAELTAGGRSTNYFAEAQLRNRR